MRRILPILAILTGIWTPAMAGRNAHGAMVVHTDDGVNYTETAAYCDTNLPLPTTCEELNPTSNKAPGTFTVVWLVAAFRPEEYPAVTTLQFGIDHPFPAGQGYFAGYAACGPSPLELPDTGWPESGFGDLVAYSDPVFDNVFKFYWFAVNHDDNTSYFSTRTYPTTNEAKFVDDSSPPVEDMCTNFGTLRWEVPGGNSCPTPTNGACCFPDGTCQVTTRVECSGQWQGMDSVCDPNPCNQPTGACCFPDGSCRVTGPAECSLEGGAYQGIHTVCIPNPCWQLTGACCLVDGTCQVTTHAECSGQWQGVDSVCDPNPCYQPSGACCFPDGACQITGPADCSLEGGAYQGNHTVCNPNPCWQPTGACCLVDGTCAILNAADCSLRRGVWQGMNTTCDPDPCPEPTGACCYEDGTCSVTTLADCAGAWQGLYTDCEPNLCPPCIPTVTSPNGGEDWQAGSEHTITWTRRDGCSDPVRIELLFRMPTQASNVITFGVCSTIATGAANTGSYPWTVQECGTGVNQYKIRITELSGGTSDMSDQPFRITPRILGRNGLNLSRVLFTTPFQPHGEIEIDLAEAGPVRVAIFNVHGQKVRDLIDDTYPVGQHRVYWDARTDAGVAAVAGVYYLRIQLDGTQITRKLVLVR